MILDILMKEFHNCDFFLNVKPKNTLKKSKRSPLIN